MPLDIQSTSLAQSPYFDDFSEDKNFHKVLFKPSVAVQARELTQLQTILQTQIERFGDNIFRTGTIIKGCSITTDDQYYYIKILDTLVDGSTFELSSFVNTFIRQEASNLTALVVNFSTGSQATNPDLNTLYVKYINTGTNGEKAFSNGNILNIYNREYRVEQIIINSGGTSYSNDDVITITGSGSGATANVITYANGTLRTITVTNGGFGYTNTPSVSISTSTGTGANIEAVNYLAQITVANNSFTAPVGVGFAAKTSEGVIYQKGHFVRVENQEVLVSKYTVNPTGVVIGFTTNEDIVTSNIDSSLLDNSSNTTNASAPGADRLKLTANLVTFTSDEAASNNQFLALYEFESGKIIKDKTAVQFNSINKELSKRTFEESGNYVVDPIPLYTEEISGNTTHVNLVVGAGLAYVEGSRVQIYNNTRIPVRKSSDTIQSLGQTISTSYGGFVYVDEMLGDFAFNTGATISLRNQPANDVTDNAGGTPTVPGTQIGTAKIRSLEWDSGIPGTPECVYRLYIFDVKMSQGFAFKDVRAACISGQAVADVVLDTVTGTAVLRDVQSDRLIFNTGTFAVQSLDDETFIFRTKTSGTFSAGGTLDLSFAGGNTVPYTSGANVSAVQERDFVVIPGETIVSSVAKTGTVSVVALTSNVVGSGTNFTSDYTVGSYIKIGTEDPRRITRIGSNTQITVDSIYSNAQSSETHTVCFPANVPIDFQNSTQRSIYTTDTSISCNLGTPIVATSAADCYHDLKIVAPAVKVKTVNNPVYVKLSTASLAQSTTGPWCLGIPDAFQITGVYVGTANTYDENTTNYVNEFILDNGQRDNYYGLSFLSKKQGSLLTLNQNNNLLVKIKAFTSGAGKYVSTESYSSAIDDVTVPLPPNRIRTQDIPVFVSPRDGRVFDLRDVIDFRPMVSNTATIATSAAAATIDPAISTDFNADEKFFPSPDRDFTANINSYLRRIDRVVLDGFGTLNVIEGIPANSPTAPSEPKGTITLGLINVSQYPSLSPKQASDSGRSDLGVYVTLTQNKRYTMKDIGDIERRISRLEYYSLLNTLEQNTKDLVIPSESNTAIERFKNGFFVDPMTDYNVSNLNDIEYSVVIDRNKGVARPKFIDNRVDLKYDQSLSTGTSRSGDLVHIDYNEKLLLEQPIANKTRSLVEQYWKFQGKINLYPQFDNYYDISRSAVSIAIDIATPLNALAMATSEALSQLNVSTSLDKVVNVGGAIHVGTRGGNDVFVQNVNKTITDTKVRISPGQENITVQDLGEFVTDFTVKPYIRDQRIYFYATGLRPEARHYPFFDNVNMSTFAAPARLTFADPFSNSLYKDVSANSFLITDIKGANLVANSTGEVAGFIDLPSDTFFVGERSFVLMDIDSISSEVSATSKAQGKFVAFSYGVNKTNLSVSTKTIDVTYDNSFTVSNYTNTYVVSDKITFERPRPNPDPLCQTFKVQRQLANTDGIYITSVDLYFNRKDENLGVTMELRETNNGVPSHIVVPFSRVRLSSSGVTVSNTASVATSFAFDSPVYLKTETDYAIVVYPDGNSPEYLVWSAETGVPDVANTALISNQNWGLGTMFYSTSGTAWTPVQDEDIKFKINRADFQSSLATAVLTNGDYEFLTVNNAIGTFVGGEEVAQVANSYLSGFLTISSSNNIIQTSVNLTSEITPGQDLLMIIANSAVQSTGNVNINSTLISNGGNQTTAFTVEYSNGDFIRIGTEIRQIVAVTNSTSMTIDVPFEGTYSNVVHYRMSPVYDLARVIAANTTTLTLSKLPNGNSNNTVIVTGQKVVRGKVDYYNGSQNKLYINESTSANGDFKIFPANNQYYGTIVGATSQARCQVSSVDSVYANLFRPLINTLVVPGTSVSMVGVLTTNSNSTDTAPYKINSSNRIAINEDAIIKSKSDEIVGTTINKSFKASFNMTTASLDTSPVIDINPSSVIISQNYINNVSTGETGRYGLARSKYISKRIVLADGLDAEDMRVFVTAYKPTGTFIDVYVKLLNSSDGEGFNDKDWTLLNQLTSFSLFSSSLDEEDYREFEYGLPLTPPATKLAGVVTAYSNTTIAGSGTTFNTTLQSGDLVKIVKSNSLTDYDIIPVVSVDSPTQITLAASVSFTGSGNDIEKVTQNKAAFKYTRNSYISRYHDSTNGAHDTFKYMAIKIVLRSPLTYLAPTIRDLRAIALSV